MNELTTTNSNLPAMPSHDLGGVGQEDLQIPTLSFVQKMSKLVDEGKAKAGDIYDPMNAVTIADEKLAAEFIPLHTSKAWRIFEVIGPQQKKYIQTVPYNDTNAHWKYTDEVNGQKISRQLVMTWHILLVKQVAEGAALPYRLSFKGMSLQTGKKLATHVAMGNMLKLPVYGKTYNLQSVKMTNDKGTFSVLEISPVRVTTPDEQKVAAQWSTMFATKGAPAVDDHDAFEGE